FDPSGQSNKLTSTLEDGRPVILAAYENLERHVQQVVIVTGKHHDALITNIHDAQIPLTTSYVYCSNASLGMGASLKAGITASQDADAWLIALGDMPYIAHRTVAAVCQRLREGAHIARPYYGDKPGHPVGFSAKMRDGLLATPDESGAAAFIRNYRHLLVTVQTDDPGCVFDVDRPSDLHNVP